MKITKITHDNMPRWISRDNGKTYLMDGDNPSSGLRRAGEIQYGPGKENRHVNMFWGRNIVGLAYNYKSLVGKKEQYDEPLFFLKSHNSVCPNGSEIVRPKNIDKVWVEVELVIVIGKECSKVSAEKAVECIYGFTVGSDITGKNVCGRDHHLARSKALDQFGPFGPYIVTDADTSDLNMETYINGRRFQKGNTSDRVMNDAECVSLVSQFITLYPGDLIFTGTPAGAMDSLVKPGDNVIHIIDNVGELKFKMV